MENSGGVAIIEELRQKVEVQAQRKSEKIKAGTIKLPSDENNDVPTNTPTSKPSPSNIFANLKKPEQVALFGGQRKSVNLFQIKPRGDEIGQNGAQGSKNIFNVQQKPVVQDQESNDDKSQGEGQGLPEQSQNTFKSEPQVKVMKFDYKNEFTRNLQMKLKKFKNGTALARQQVYVTLESLQGQPSTLYLIIRAQTTKVVVYQGLLVKNISKMEHFMGKEDNLKFDVLRKNASSNEEEGSGSKLRREVVKLLFEDVQSCEEFESVVNRYFGVQGTQ